MRLAHGMGSSGYVRRRRSASATTPASSAASPGIPAAVEAVRHPHLRAPVSPPPSEVDMTAAPEPCEPALPPDADATLPPTLPEDGVPVAPLPAWLLPVPPEDAPATELEATMTLEPPGVDVDCGPELELDGGATQKPLEQVCGAWQVTWRHSGSEHCPVSGSQVSVPEHVTPVHSGTHPVGASQRCPCGQTTPALQNPSHIPLAGLHV